MSQIDYDGICKLAAEIGCRRDDLIALADGNDPFYVGVPRRRQAAEWFASLWDRLGFQVGSHPRRLHYILVSQDPPVLKPNGQPYQNTEDDWKSLITASLGARYLRLLPEGALADHRNDQPILNADIKASGVPGISVVNRNGAGLNYLVDPKAVLKPFAYPEGFEASQDYVVEVWVEKSTQNDILLPLARKLGFNLVSGAGETSEILARQAVERAVLGGRPTHIMYVSDFDPGGRSMPVALARKIEFWLREFDLEQDITLNPIVLTPEQCETYRLPRTPLKATERRAAKFQQRFGAGATELDALEALHPGELANIVEQEVCRYLDPTLGSRVAGAKWDFYSVLKRAGADIIEHHDVSSVEKRHIDIIERFHMDMQELEDETRGLWSQIADEIDAAVEQIKIPDLPEPKPARPPEAPLFDSKRDYLEQIDHYRAWQGKDTA